MDWKTVIAAIGTGFGVYVIGSFILFKQLDANDYFEVIGYINGLVRGAGSEERAIELLNNWRDYWLRVRPYLGFLIDHFYNYGLSRIQEEYGA